MRKSNLSKSEIQDKRRKIMVIIVAVFFIGLMVFSSFAFVFLSNPTGQIGGSGSQTVEELGQEFSVVQVEETSLWQTRFNDVEAYFYLLPSQLGVFEIDDGAVNPLLQSQMTHITFNSSDSNVSVIVESLGLLTDTLETLQVSTETGSITEENDFGLDQITCEDATSETPVLYVQLSEELVGVTQIDTNCYAVAGFDPIELIYVTEFYRYTLFGLNIGE